VPRSERLRAEVERLLTVGSASGADDVGAELTCELRDHRRRRTAFTKAATGGDQRRPATLTRQTLRATAGDTTGHPTTPGKVTVYSGRKQTRIPAATIVRIQSSR
jgi:hypothetical protein